MIIGTIVSFALFCFCAVGYAYLLVKTKKHRASLAQVQAQIDRISIHTSDQQLAKKGYFLLGDQKQMLELELNRIKAKRKNILVMGMVFGISGIVFLFFQ